ncbi:MAG: K(+)-transporting ATPase subunit F [Labilithrix sp.]|nr:K(+)-transporting ATPase subunit F [Labilithrix sp.]MBX3223076.1 K(+)-transporting ATPase subunit F [Labilithrix sp.]
MPALYVIGAVIAVGLFVYLLFAMLAPERLS